MALAAVGVPLLIHLINLKKPQKVDFSSLAFFEDLKNTTIRRLNIKRYLLLLLRLAAIASLALVLARPFLPPGLSGTSGTEAPALNAILLDNSISMSRIGAKGPLFDYAKEVTLEISEAARDEDRYIVQFTNGEAENNNIFNRSALHKGLDEAQIQPAGNYTPERFEALITALRESPYQNKNLYYITDSQESQLSGIENLDLETEGINLTVIDVGEVNTQNTVISNVSSSTNMVGTDIPFTIHVELANRSDVAAVNQFVSLEFEERMAGQYSVSLQPGERKTYTFEVTPTQTGAAVGKVVVEGDEFQPDNEHHFAIQVPEQREVLWLHSDENNSEFRSYTGLMLQAAGQNDAQLRYDRVTADRLESENLKQYDILLLDGLTSIPEFAFQPLQQFVQKGGGLLFFPSEQGDLTNYNDLLNTFNAGRYAGVQGSYASFESIARGSDLLEDHPAFSGMFERDEQEELRFKSPDIFYYYKLQPSGGGAGFNLLSMDNGDPLLHEKRIGQGRFLVSAIGNDPGWSNFPVQPLFAPFYYRVVLYAAASDEGGFAAHTLGTPFSWTGNIEPGEAVLTMSAGEEQIRPSERIVSGGVQLTYPGQEWQPGWMYISDENREFAVALNLPKTESDFSIAGQTEIEDKLGTSAINWIDAEEINTENLQEAIKASGFGHEIWHWFMFVGLLFLIAETVVSIWYKTESIS